MKTIRVNASGSYDILIGRNALRSLGERVGALNAKRSVIVSDDNVFPLYGAVAESELMKAGMECCRFVFPHGEKSKTLATYGALLEFMAENRFTRSDLVVALGGGVVGDLAGFAAATYQRGVRYVQVSTTLLSDVDSSVGGKTAVDLVHGKNQVGAFHQPSLVVIDPDTLETLPEEELKCGYAETIKYGIFGDATFFAEMERTPIIERAEEAIFRAVTMKKEVVERDEFDRGDRMILNFGHTFGHGVEKCSGFTVLHGQAVAMGMAAITRAAWKRGYCGSDTVRRVEAILKSYGLPTEIPYGRKEMEDAIFSDKKMTGSKLRIVVPREIGRCTIETIDASEVADWLRDGGVA